MKVLRLEVQKTEFQTPASFSGKCIFRRHPNRGCQLKCVRGMGVSPGTACEQGVFTSHCGNCTARLRLPCPTILAIVSTTVFGTRRHDYL